MSAASVPRVLLTQQENDNASNTLPSAVKRSTVPSALQLATSALPSSINPHLTLIKYVTDNNMAGVQALLESGVHPNLAPAPVEADAPIDAAAKVIGWGTALENESSSWSTAKKVPPLVVAKSERMVELLVQYGADVNSYTRGGKSLLFAHASRGWTQTFGALFRHGIKCSEDDLCSLLKIGASGSSSVDVMLREARTRGMRIPASKLTSTPSDVRVYGGMLPSLLSSKVLSISSREEAKSMKELMLHTDYRIGSPVCIHRLEQYRMLHYPCSYGSLLHAAVMYHARDDDRKVDFLHTLELLLAAGVDINEVGAGRVNAIQRAVSSMCNAGTRVIGWLLQHGADLYSRIHGYQFIEQLPLRDPDWTSFVVRDCVNRHPLRTAKSLFQGARPIEYVLGIRSMPSSQQTELVLSLLDAGTDPNICTGLPPMTPLDRIAGYIVNNTQGALTSGDLWTIFVELLRYGASCTQANTPIQVPFCKWLADKMEKVRVTAPKALAHDDAPLVMMESAMKASVVESAWHRRRHAVNMRAWLWDEYDRPH
jgi:hypothetical protein